MQKPTLTDVSFSLSLSHASDVLLTGERVGVLRGCGGSRSRIRGGHVAELVLEGVLALQPHHVALVV
jgi:hypothetical protein